MECGELREQRGRETGEAVRVMRSYLRPTVAACVPEHLSLESDSQILVLPHVLTLPEIFNIKTEVKLDKISGVTSLICHCTFHGASQIIGLCCPPQPPPLQLNSEC